MAIAKQQPTMKYAVTLLIEGSKLETVAKKIKDAVGDVKIIGDVEKVVAPGVGEWSTEWSQPEGYRDPVLANTDGRTIRRVEGYKEWDKDDKPVESSKITYYEVRDSYGKQISADDGSKYGKWQIETLEEAKSAVRVPLTQAEILEAADRVAAHVAEYGAVTNKKNQNEAGLAERAAKDYLMARHKIVPEEYYEEEGKGYRTAPEYVVTLRIKASTLPAVEKKAKAAFGDKLIGVEKVGRGFSLAKELAEAEFHRDEAVEIIGGLKEHMEEWRDNMPDNFQGTEKHDEVDECASTLETLEDELKGLNFDVDFPGMF